MPLGDSPTQRWSRHKSKSGKGLVFVNDGSGLVLDCGQAAKLGSAAIVATKAENPVANQAWEIVEIDLKKTNPVRVQIEKNSLRRAPSEQRPQFIQRVFYHNWHDLSVDIQDRN